MGGLNWNMMWYCWDVGVRGRRSIPRALALASTRVPLFCALAVEAMGQSSVFTGASWTFSATRQVKVLSQVRARKEAG